MKEEVIAEVGVSSLSLTFSIFLPGFLGPLKKLSIKFDKKNQFVSATLTKSDKLMYCLNEILLHK